MLWLGADDAAEELPWTRLVGGTGIELGMRLSMEGERLYVERNLYAKAGTGAALIAWRRRQEPTTKRRDCTCMCGTQSSMCSVSRPGSSVVVNRRNWWWMSSRQESPLRLVVRH